MRETHVEFRYSQGLGLLGGGTGEPKLGLAGRRFADAHQLESHPLTDTPSQGLEARFLRREPRRQRGELINAVATRGQLFGREDTLLKPAVPAVDQLLESLRSDDIDTHTDNHSPLPEGSSMVWANGMPRQTMLRRNIAG